VFLRPEDKRGGLWWKVGAYTDSETSVHMRKQEAIEKPYSDLLVIHHRKYIHNRTRTTFVECKLS
jgi:hypothetical protein